MVKEYKNVKSSCLNYQEDMVLYEYEYEFCPKI